MKVNSDRYGAATTEARHITTRLSMDARKVAEECGKTAVLLHGLPEILDLISQRLDDPQADALLVLIGDGMGDLVRATDGSVSEDTLLGLSNEGLIALSAVKEIQFSTIQVGYAAIVSELTARAAEKNGLTREGQALQLAAAHHASNLMLFSSID